MNRIIDANLNRATEALRNLEEIARFKLNNAELCFSLKSMRHKISEFIDKNYELLLKNRNTEEDRGKEITSPTERKNIADIHKANFKRLQQALRVLEEYFSAENNDSSKIFEELRYISYTLEKTMFAELSVYIKSARLADKNLYLVTDRTGFSSVDAFLDKIAGALQGGIKIVQLREKNTSPKEIIEIGKSLRTLCSCYDALFIVNDRPDIALATEADGVHLGQDDIDIKTARQILGTSSIIGISTHCPEHAIKAMEFSADYAGVGPVFETPTKPGRKAAGLEYVRWAKENMQIPWFAIGGINTENIEQVKNAGAERIAIVRAVMSSENPQKTVTLLLN